MVKILELFSGYGTASFALKRLCTPYECVGYSDIDKYANQCFRQNHSGKELGDVKNIKPEELPDFDLLTGGFPCQAFSVAGKQLGELDPRGTLFYEIIRIAEVKKPRYMLLENVKGLTSKKFKDTFEKILSELGRIGYYVRWRVLNSKDFGIPQSRARVWFVCFREQAEWTNFKWPEPVELKIFVKDILEENVDEKYFLSDKLQEDFKELLKRKNPKIANCLQARDYKGVPGFEDVTEKQRFNLIVAQRQRDRHGINEEKGQQLEPREDGCSNTLTSVQKDNLIVLGSLETEGWEKRFEEIRRIYSPEGIAPTLPTGQGGGVIPKFFHELKIRRLTPKEYFRLQGFLNDEINLDGLSDTQKYKLAGNGQDVNMVTKIFERMFKCQN